MDCETGSRKRLRLNPHAKALRRTRIFVCLRSGWSYEAIAREEKVTPRRIRQIVGEVLKRREVDAGPDHAMLQLVRLEGRFALPQSGSRPATLAQSGSNSRFSSGSTATGAERPPSKLTTPKLARAPARQIEPRRRPGALERRREAVSACGRRRRP